MSIDYEFAMDMFSRYSKHLEDVIESINTNIFNYGSQVAELERIAEKYPERYMKRLEEVSAKKAEAQKKLDVLLPRMKKMADQIEEFKKFVQ